MRRERNLRIDVVRTFAWLLPAAAVLSCAVALTTPSRASAQDMVFDLGDSGAPAPAAEGPPSEALANALRLYQQERYMEAAVQFQRVVGGETDDAPGNVEKAQFFLGKSLYHLHFYQSALAIFDEITQNPAHSYFAQTLQWLAQLASQLPEAAGIVERIGRYGVEMLEQFNTPEQADLYNQLLYLMGRFQYSQGEFEAAIELFDRVAEDSRFYIDGRFFAGISHVRLRHARPAVAAFRGIIDAIEAGRSGVEDTERMRNLAWLSLARVYYAAANHVTDEGEREVDGALLGNAVSAWNSVSQDSEYWLDALFEESWAFFLADEYSRAMGNIHTLFAPYFDDAYYPEALVLKAVVFFSACQIDNAQAMISQFHERYDSVATELNSSLDSFEGDNNRFFEFLVALRDGHDSTLSPTILPIVSTALSDRTVLRNLEYVRLLEAEEAHLNESPAEFRNSPLGARILQDIFVAKSFAIDSTGELVHTRLNRLIDELNDLLNQVDTIDLEIATYLRGELSAEAQDQMTEIERAGGLSVVVDEEHQMWPFDGEYWRDELGFYRQQVTPRCGR